MTQRISAPKGTKDVLPSEVYKWHYVEETARSCAEQFGFTEIRFPTFEHTELFLRGVGDTTDIVNKEMYTFNDKAGRSITLRPEGTASVVRAAIENGLLAKALPLKVFYFASIFRYDKPQAGRYREHHQFGIECFGSDKPETDAEVIGVADTYIKRLGINDVHAEINSIGCAVCRPEYHKLLKEYFYTKKNDLCPTCLDRLERNPLRVLDCKSPVCGEIAESAPKSADHLCEACAEHFAAVKRNLDIMDIKYQYNPLIVRGLDYYTRTVFEFRVREIGAQATIPGGGRYDLLVETLGGDPCPGIGFGCGLERILLSMEAKGIEIPAPGGPDLFVASAGDECSDFIQSFTHKLRVLGLSAERDIMGRSLQKQMKHADKLGARFSMVIGGDETASGRAVIKDMRGGGTAELPLDAAAVREYIVGRN